MHIKSGQPPCAANQEGQTNQPREFLNEVNRRRRIELQTAHTPAIRKGCWCDSKTDNVRKRVKLFAEFAIRAREARHKSVKRIENERDTNGPRCKIQSRVSARKHRDDRVVSAKQIADRKE